MIINALVAIQHAYNVQRMNVLNANSNYYSQRAINVNAMSVRIIIA